MMIPRRTRSGARTNSTPAVATIATVWSRALLCLLAVIAIPSASNPRLRPVAASEPPFSELSSSAKRNETSTSTTTSTTTTATFIASPEERRRLLSSSSSSSRRPESLPFLLGVMVDAGRHDVPVEWLESFLTLAHRMGFNALHLKLTSDQKFAIGSARQTEKWKRLARHAKQLGDLTILPEVSVPFFAASWAHQDVIGGGESSNTNASSINPGNQLAPPRLLPPPHCPRYLCSSERAFPTVGTNLPLDIGHPDLPETIRRLLRDLLTVLDQPAYLHLGGSGSGTSAKDYHRSEHDCWREALEEDHHRRHHRTKKEPKQSLDRLLRDEYRKFEAMLDGILANDLGYRPTVVVRGASGGDSSGDREQRAKAAPGAEAKTNVTGRHQPAVREYRDHREALRDANSTNRRPYLLHPNELNLATTLATNHPTGWEVYQQTREILTAHCSHVPLAPRDQHDNEHESSSSPSSFLGLFLSTDAMPPEWFEPRNVLGRMLAVSMAATDVENHYLHRNIEGTDPELGALSTERDMPHDSFFANASDFERAYLERCRGLFPAANDGGASDDTAADRVLSSARHTICDRLGGLKSQQASASWSDRMARRIGVQEQNHQRQERRQHFRTQSDISRDANYKKAYGKLWKDWADEICHRLTETKHELEWLPSTHADSIRDAAFAAHWREDGDGWKGGEEPAERDPRDSFESPASVLFHEALGATRVPVRGIIVDLVEDASVSPALLEEWMERVLVPLGLNALQLSLLNRLGCALRLSSLEWLHHAVPKPIVDPWTDESLGRIVAFADRLGLELIPEISVTTEALGWYHAGFLVDCPNTLCRSQHSGGGSEEEGTAVANDVRNGSLLPVILRMVRKLRGIFRSGSFLHLGSDERRASGACWRESGGDTVPPNYDAFEQRLSDLLVETFGWYNSSSILRWENREGISYPQRTGAITQYRYGVPDAKPDGGESDQLTFGSLSITPERSPWSVYLETREWVERRPEGLLARISVGGILDDPASNEDTGQQTKMGLLAFAVGLSSNIPPLEDASALDSYLANLCTGSPNDSHVLCRISSHSGARGVQRPKGSRGSLLCRAMTRSVSRPVMRSSLASTPTSVDNGGGIA